MAKKALSVAKSDFPLYCVHMVGERHLIVAGGGGSAKTGVPNAMDIYELKYENNSISLHKVFHYETKTRAVMNCDVAQQDKHFYLAAGVDNSCWLHVLRYKVMVPKVENEVLEGVRKRKNNFTNSTNHNTAPKMIGFEIEPTEEVVTDKSQDGGFQKVVRFAPDTKHLVTGGSEGCLRCWEFPSLSMVYETECHSNEIDDIYCSPDNKYVVTVSKDNTSYVWNLKDGTKVAQLIWKHENAKMYRARHCRFARVKDKGENEYSLFTTHIPVTRTRDRISCYIVKWESTKFTSTKYSCTGSEILSAIAVSDDGVYLGVGTISGSVSVYISFSLKRLYHVHSAHNIFVTGLSFCSSTPGGRAVTGNNEFTLFSISADNYIKAHQKESETTYSIFWVFIGACLLTFIIFWILNTYQIFEWLNL